MQARKRKSGDALSKAIIKTGDAFVSFRKQFQFSWREVLDYYQNRPFSLASDPERRLVVSWTDRELPESEEPPQMDAHYTLKAHVTGHSNRDFWHTIYTFVILNFPLVSGLISFETGQDGQPYLKFYSSAIDSSLMLKLLLRWKELNADTVVTGWFLLTTLRLNKLL